MEDKRQVNRRFSTDKIQVSYAHVGLFDVDQQKLWIAKMRTWGTIPIRVSHARLLARGTHEASTADKDRFLCTWFHTPGTGQGHVHGYPIEWDEGHLLIRLDPNWNYLTRSFIASTETAKIERNIEQQYEWGQKIFATYLALNPPFPICWHMIGPRATDSMFYIERVAPSDEVHHPDSNPHP